MRFLRRLAGAVAFVFHTLYRASLIRGTARLPRRRIAWTYLKLKAKHFLIKLIPGLRFRRERLFGDEVATFDYFMLVCMYETVFVQQDYFFRTESKQPFILDCGSNIGLSVLYFKKLFPESRVIAFEPDPVTFALLEKNVAAQGLRDVQLHNRAVFSTTGPVDFYYDPAEPGSVCMSLRGELMPAKRTVEAVTLSSFIDGEVDFLKLDVEGAEMAVLREAAQSGKLRHIREMAVEYHHHMATTDDRFSEFLRLLEENGYGYVLQDAPERPFAREKFEPILVYAYRKPD
ncbi:MAG: FkbM family methyltransferase [Acidobacteria bacterium]|nr:FkbM family methyltransferase [Acidobacteriota bacterium]